MNICGQKMTNSLVKTIKLLAQYEYDYLYHVTFISSLPGIQSSGLQAGSGQTFQKGYQAGKLFVTEKDGVFFWNSKYEDWANHKSDDPLVDGLIPVTLRFRVTPDIEESLDIDEEGTRDAMYDALYIEDGSIPSSDLELFNGTSWVPVDEVDIGELRLLAEGVATEEDIDGEIIVWPDFDVFNPGIY